MITRNKLMVLASAAILTMTSLTAFAGKDPRPIRMGTGGPTGNYFGMANDVNDYCGDATGIGLDIQNSKGSIDNLLGMGSKKYSAGWVQEDVLQYYAKQTPNKVNRNRLKVIMMGHLETAHLLIPKGYAPKSEGSWYTNLGTIFATKPEGISLDLLKNQTVGSWGGSLISAKAVSMFMELNLNVVEVPDAMREVAGEYPIFLVGGQPYSPVAKLLATGKYDLVPINADTLSNRAAFYAKTIANYEVGGKIISTPTFAVRALILGKSYRKDKKNEPMKKLAKCITDSIEDLADDPDTNSNWSSVAESVGDGAQSTWTYFPI